VICPWWCKQLDVAHVVFLVIAIGSPSKLTGCWQAALVMVAFCWGMLLVAHVLTRGPA
jgi:hypothetical protein